MNSGDASTVMRTSDRQLLREVQSLDPERRCAPDVLARMRRAGWSVASIASLVQMSVGEVTEILRERTR